MNHSNYFRNKSNCNTIIERCCICEHAEHWVLDKVDAQILAHNPEPNSAGDIMKGLDYSPVKFSKPD